MDFDGVSRPVRPEPPELPEFPFKLPELPENPSVIQKKPDTLPIYSDKAQPLDVDDGGDDCVLLEIDEIDEIDEQDGLLFELSLVPGGVYQGEIDEPVEIEVEEDEALEVVDDPWGWQISTFPDWLSHKMQGVPQHSGRDSAGLERAISYLEEVDRHISKAVRSDKDGAIDISRIEKARTSLYDGLVRLQDRLEKIQSNTHPKKKKKKADENPDMVKEGQKSTHVGGIIVTVPLLISTIARTCLNSMISAGKDIEDVFDRLADKYDLTPREEMETMQLLADMGYPLRRPRGYNRDEEIDYTSTDNFDWAQNFPA